MSMRDLTGAVNFTALERMTGGMDEVTLEVLDLFTQQAALWAPLLVSSHEGWRDALHTLRGAAGGIGAEALAQVCAQVEQGDVSLAPAGLSRVHHALNQALFDVAIYRHRLMLRVLAG